jgi:hypothetical protein
VMALLSCTPAHMLCEHSHILHDQLRLFEDLRIDALQDKVFFFVEVVGDKIGIVDVAVPEFAYIADLPLGTELLRNLDEFVQKSYLLVGWIFRIVGWLH